MHDYERISNEEFYAAKTALTQSEFCNKPSQKIIYDMYNKMVTELAHLNLDNLQEESKEDKEIEQENLNGSARLFRNVLNAWTNIVDVDQYTHSPISLGPDMLGQKKRKK